ncbi:MAG TPA: histone deacetylase [Vicinamibacterales bacterium]|jgi:acetoin utilization deacetylase AcuC-like enzyme
MSFIVISTERFAEHQTPPGHPECPERAEVMDVVASEWRGKGGEVVAPREATREQLARVHGGEYLRRISETAGSAVALDPDTYTSPETYEIALLAAGAAVDGVERVMGGGHKRVLAMVRPPGHHAEHERAMGFCFYNNVAVGAAHAKTLGARRIAIVDYDVHHGNGTQHLFESDPSVLYVSTHQYPYYPGTGAAGEIGVGPGAGYTVNLPLEAGAVNEDYRHVFDAVVLPVLKQFAPDLMLVSAGFDAHERDPLGGMRLTSDAFAAMTAQLRTIAEECCGGRLVLVTEGGYDFRALADSLRGVVGVLASETTPPAAWPAAAGAEPSRGRASADATARLLRGHWRL